MLKKNIASICFMFLFVAIFFVGNEVFALEVNKVWIQEEVQDTSKEWIIGFDKELDINSVTTDKIFIVDENGYIPEVYLELSKDKKNVTIIPVKPYEENKTYYIYATSVIEYSDKTLLGKEMKIPFRVIVTLEKAENVQIKKEDKKIDEKQVKKEETKEKTKEETKKETKKEEVKAKDNKESKQEKMKTDGTEYAGYIVDSYYKGNKTYAVIDTGVKRDYEVKNWNDKKDECLVVFTNNEDGSINIKTGRFDDYKIYKGPILSKNESKMVIMDAGVKKKITFPSDAIYYDEDAKKSRDNVFVNRNVELIIKGRRVEVVKILDKDNQESKDDSNNKFKYSEEVIGYVLDTWKANGQAFAKIEFIDLKNNENLTGDFKVYKNTNIPTEYVVYTFKLHEKSECEILDKNLNGIKMYAGEIKDIKGNNIIYTDGNKEYTFKFTNETISYSDSGEKITLGMLEKNTLARVFVEGDVIRIIELYYR